MVILLIGGTGVLSAAVAKEALRRQISVTMVNRGSRPTPDGVELIKADCFNYDYLEEQLRGRWFDAVIDFLCYTEKATENSFKLYHKFTKQYFFISSCAVYNTNIGGIMDEDSPKVLPIWSYSVNKWKSEQLLCKLAEGTDCCYTIIRPGITYGDTRIPYGIMPHYGFHWTLCARILADKPVIRWNEGKNKCNMTHVEDFAVGVVGLIGNARAFNEAFNVCGDEIRSFNDVLSILQDELHHEVRTVDIAPAFYAKEAPHRAGEILGGRSLDSVYSNNKIRSVVPYFRQTIVLEKGVSRTLKAYIDENYQKGIDFRFDADTDRIIRKWCRENKQDPKQYHLGFVDYLGSATKADRRTYWLEFHKDNIIIRGFNLITHLVRRIKRSMKQ